MKKLKKIINQIKYEHLELISFAFMMLWAISPMIEYGMKNISFVFDFYWTSIIYIAGFLGIVEYVLYLYIRYKEGKKVVDNRFLLICFIIPFVISIISTICSNNPLLSFFGESYRKEGFLVYLMYVGFILSASFIKDKNHIKIIANTIIISAIYIGILPLFENDFTYFYFSNIFYNLNHYGYFLMITLMISIFMFIDSTKNKKIRYGFAYIFLLYLLIRNDTFGCYLSVVVSLIALFIYALIKKQKRLIVTFVMLIFILESFLVSHYDIKIGERVHFEKDNIILKNFQSLFNDTNTVMKKDYNSYEMGRIGTGRGLLWREAMNYTLQKPIIGGGMESLDEYYKSHDVKYSDRPHNIILQISSFIGIPCTLIYLSFIFYIGFKCLKRINGEGMYMMVYFTAMSYFISSMFGNSMYYTSPYFMILLGLLISISKNKEVNKKE